MNIEIANRLQKLRKENGYSQEELALKLGISRQAVSKWERAESSPDTDNLIILARLYNMSLDELLYDTESNDEIRDRVIDKEDLKIDNENLKNNTCCENNCCEKEKLSKNKIKALSIIDSIIVFITLISYLCWSFINNAWYVSWVLWILMPAIMSVFEAIFKKQITNFLYPCLVTALYCFIGMQFNIWHPTWILFVSIPVFYLISDPIDKYIFKTKKTDESKKSC